MESSNELRVYCEDKMRQEMHYFIHEQEAELIFLANPALVFGDRDMCKNAMHTHAHGMDLRIEMEFLMRSGMALNFLAHQSKQSTSEFIVVVKKISLSTSLEENQYLNAICGNAICEVEDFYYTLSKSNPFYTLNTSCELLDEAEQLLLHESETEILYLPCTQESKSGSKLGHRSDELPNSSSSHLLDEMFTQLLCRLIGIVKYLYLIYHREEFKRLFKTAPMSAIAAPTAMDLNRAPNWKAERACSRENFFRRAELKPLELLRVIDIEATCRQGSERVVLIDYLTDSVQQVVYTAISHTYGMDVYDVFNCPCASETCSSAVELRPRCWAKPCPHATEHQDASSDCEKHKRVINDILKMCSILRKARVSYAWHDGVCIAQHDEHEVNRTIQHMGWIYSKAKETIIFLHYVGNPMAPLRSSNDINEFGCRWHTRVWTLQEAALSECRRYCVRVGTSPLMGDCKSLEEFEEQIALWYGHNSSTVEILEEETFFKLLTEIQTLLVSLIVNLAKQIPSTPHDVEIDVIVQTNWMWHKVATWSNCIRSLLYTLLRMCFEFPTLESALIECSGRDSKHKGDRINSILSLAEVKDFVADKDEKLEASTIEFFKKQGQLGLAIAVFSSHSTINYMDKQYITQEHKHTWPPVLWIKGLTIVGSPNLNQIEFEVLEDGRMELRSRDFNWMIWVPVRFTYKNVTNPEMEVDSMNDGHVWDMELTDFNPFKANLFGVHVGNVFISVIKRCNSQTYASAGDIIDYEGDSSFDAHLVIVFDGIGSGILIVQGSLLDAHVCKVGLVIPEDDQQQFWKLLLENNLPPASAFIKKLIIM